MIIIVIGYSQLPSRERATPVGLPPQPHHGDRPLLGLPVHAKRICSRQVLHIIRIK